VSGDVAKCFDCAFWFGDMNFRLAMSGGRTNVEAVLKGLEQKKSETYELLVNHDELHDAQNNGERIVVVAADVALSVARRFFDLDLVIGRSL
jgi:hypothetical protein